MSTPTFPHKFGQIPSKYDSRDALYASIRPKIVTSLPKIPSTFGHGNDFLAENWKMFANGPDKEVDSKYEAAAQGCGDCTIAGPLHEIMEHNSDAKRPIPNVTANDAVKIYAKLSGYDPYTGEGDTGLEIRSVLQYRQKTGIKDADGKYHKIGPYVALEVGNFQQILEALYLFENVGIGFEVPESAMIQFNKGEPWSVVPGRSRILGGHYVPLVGRPNTSELALVTWARKQTMTEGFFNKYVGEAWAYISPDQISTVTKKSYEGYNQSQLEEYIHLVG